MRDLKVVITYGDDTWTQMFELEDGEEVQEVLDEIQDDWYHEFKDSLGEMDWNQYDIQYEIVK
jgi:hypothetical protein